MQPRNLSDPNVNLFVTTIGFSLINQPKSYERNDDELEYLLPAFAKVITQNLGSMAKYFSISPQWNAFKELNAVDVKIKILTNSELTQEDNQAIVLAIQDSLKHVFSQDAENLIFNSEVKVTSEVNDEPTAKYKGTVSERNYAYNKIYQTTAMEIEFLDESEKSVSMNGKTQKQYAYNHVGCMTKISYKYTPHTPPSKELTDVLEKEVKQYVESNPKYKPFYASILAQDYNKALRQACSAGNIDLVDFLFECDQYGELNLDINQSSLNGHTPLEYAIRSENNDLIELIIKNDGVTSKDLIPSFADVDRRRIMNQNPQNKEKSSYHHMSSILSQANNNVNHHSSHFDEIEEINRINRINRENQLAREREDARRLEELNRMNALNSHNAFNHFNSANIGMNINPSSFGSIYSPTHSFSHQSYMGDFFRPTPHQGGMNHDPFNRNRENEMNSILNPFANNHKRPF